MPLIIFVLCCVVVDVGCYWLLLVVVGLDPHLDPPPCFGQFLLWPIPSLASSYFGQSRQAAPSEGRGRCWAQFCGVATSRSQRRGRPLLGRVSVGESPMGKFVVRGRPSYLWLVGPVFFLQAWGLIAVGQRLAPMSKARTN